MEIGDITALTEYAVLILFYVMMAQMVLMLLPRAKVCLERIDAVLSHRPEITDGAGSLPQTEGEAVCAFQHAWFRFADADEATLQDLDFVLRRGQTIAIIGSTGSGKSTIAKLLLRFHDVTQGAICFDGADLRTLRQEDLRQRIAYVPQKAWLFSGTVAENLRHGNPRRGRRTSTTPWRWLRRALWTACPGDSRPGWSRGAGTSPGARSSGWPSPGP
ncbi:MAG: ATP-binding cassette domain-containing protein [Evtepia gabavorous]